MKLFNNKLFKVGILKYELLLKGILLLLKILIGGGKIFGFWEDKFKLNSLGKLL